MKTILGLTLLIITTANYASSLALQKAINSCQGLATSEIQNVVDYELLNEDNAFTQYSIVQLDSSDLQFDDNGLYAEGQIVVTTYTTDDSGDQFNASYTFNALYNPQTGECDLGDEPEYSQTWCGAEGLVGCIQ